MDVRRRQPIGVELVRRGIVNENDIEEYGSDFDFEESEE